MREGVIKGIQVATNIAIIFTAALLCAVLIRNYMMAKPAAGPPSAAADSLRGSRSVPSRRFTETEVRPGTRVSLDGLDWAKNGHTLLLAISDKCHFCSESAPFYQRLAKVRGNTQLVAVLPQAVAEGKTYLETMNVAVDDIRQSSLNSLGVKGTPTLILVDANGAIVKSWTGKLAPDREAEVLASLK